MKRPEKNWLFEGRTSAGGPVISTRCLMHVNNRHHSFSALQGNQRSEKRRLPIQSAAYKRIVSVIQNGRYQSGPIWTD
jgi:hypothetical protein